MAQLAGLATASFILVAAIVGTRLLLLARRTRQLPELAAGLALLLVVAIGYPQTLIGTLSLVSPSASLRLFEIGTTATAVGSIFIFVFTRSVFRPASRWARVFETAAAVAILALLSVALLQVQRGAALTEVHSSKLAIARYTVYILGYVWTSIEAIRYRRLYLRRMAIGLGDPVVANRFLLWAVAGGSATAGLAAAIGSIATGHTPTGMSTFAMAIVGMTGVVSGMTTYLAFMPPASYRRWIAQRRTPAAA